MVHLQQIRYCCALLEAKVRNTAAVLPSYTDFTDFVASVTSGLRYVDLPRLSITLMIKILRQQVIDRLCSVFCILSFL